MMDCWKEDAASRPTFKSLQWHLEEYFTFDGIQMAYGDTESNILMFYFSNFSCTLECVITTKSIIIYRLLSLE